MNHHVNHMPAGLVPSARRLQVVVLAVLFGAGAVATPSAAQKLAPDRDSVTIRLANTELRAAVQLFGQYLDRPVLFSGTGGGLVTLETPRPVPRADIPRLLQSLLESQNYELVNDSVGKVYRHLTIRLSDAGMRCR